MSVSRIFTSHSTSIFHNLSFEEILLKQASSPSLFLYRNSKNVVIGRHQNPWKELHMDRVHSDQVELCRRKTGGGAVYQDLGNSVFSFITPGSFESSFKQRNNTVVLRALSALGVQAALSGRNDILVKGKKVSGSAYKIVQSATGSVFLHHGTMLLSINKDNLFKYLNPHKDKLKSKGIDSVASRVMNLAEINPAVTHDSFVQVMKDSFKEQYTATEELEVTDFPPEANLLASEYAQWEWRYGESPQFSHQLEHRFEWGLVDLNLQVVGGVITEVKLFSDCLNAEFVPFVENSLLSAQYGAAAAERLDSQCQGSEWESMGTELSEWLHCAM